MPWDCKEGWSVSAANQVSLAGQYEDVDTVAVAALFSERCPTDCQAESLLQSLLAEWKGFQNV